MRFGKLKILFLFGFMLLISLASTKNENSIQEAYHLVRSQSFLHWRGDNHTGTIPFCEGQLIMKNNLPTVGLFFICMDSLQNTDIDYHLMRSVLENTLKSKEFFYTEKFPKASFSIYSSQPAQDDKVIIHGDLTLKNITKCISFDALFTTKQDSLHAITDSIKIDRTDWGINSMSVNHVKGDEAYIISDTLVILLDIIAVKAPV
jgi:hypothetical protein